MDLETRQVLNGFMTLSAEQRADAIDQINKWLELNENQKQAFQKSLKEQISSRSLGPYGARCKCCGK